LFLPITALPNPHVPRWETASGENAAQPIRRPILTTCCRVCLWCSSTIFALHHTSTLNHPPSARSFLFMTAWPHSPPPFSFDSASHTFWSLSQGWPLWCNLWRYVVSSIIELSISEYSAPDSVPLQIPSCLPQGRLQACLRRSHPRRSRPNQILWLKGSTLRSRFLPPQYLQTHQIPALLR